MRSKLKCWNLHTFSMGWHDFTKMLISSKRLSGFLWTLVRWKICILGYNILIDTNKRIITKRWEKCVQNFCDRTPMLWFTESRPCCTTAKKLTALQQGRLSVNHKKRCWVTKTLNAFFSLLYNEFLVCVN